MIQKTIPPPFKILIESGSLIVTINDELRDRSWGAYFGELQHALREYLWNGQEIKECYIDFNQCCWADPLPLLHLVIAIAEFSDSGKKAQIRIPKPGVEKSDKFLKFLSNEGFIELFDIVTQNNVLVGDKHINPQAIEEFSNLGTTLAYVNSTLIKAHLFKMNSHEEVGKWVNKQIDLLSSTFNDRVPEWAIDEVLYKLKTFLFETMCNIVDHAYSHKKMGYGVVYARYRKGMLLANAEEKKSLKDALEKESDDRFCPALPKYWLEGKEGCLEATVVDSGIGLSKSLENILTVSGVPAKLRFRLACTEVFYKGLLVRKKNNSTKYGGLHLLNRLLGENHDFIRGYDEDQWVGTILPLERLEASISPGALGTDHCGFPVSGLAWTCRLSWPSPTDKEEYGMWKKWKGPISQNPILKEFGSLDVDPKRYQQTFIEDSRFSEIIGKNNPSQFDGHNYYLLLPSSGLSKNDIIGKINSIAAKNQSGNKLSLIIGEIPSHEATTYVIALDGYLSGKGTILSDKLSVLTLVSQQFAVFAFSYKGQEQGFVRNDSTADIFLSSKIKEGFHPDTSIRHYIQLLRYHDSQVFWKYLLFKHKDDGTYIGGDVFWTKDLTIHGYLDFAQTLTDSFCRKFYRLLLQRLPCLTPNANDKCKLIPIDSTVHTLASRFNSTVLPRLHGKNVIHINVGSIQVTGLTQNMNSTNNTSIPTIHFFRHPNASINAAHLMLWPQPGVLPKTEDKFTRLGNTPWIAPSEWDSFQLPREDDSGNYAYGCSSQDTYNDWQDVSPCIIKAGHWQYEANHDVLTVNLWNSLKFSFFTQGDLACFLIRNFFNAFGISDIENGLTDEGKEWFKKIVPLGYSEIPNVEAIVYPSHPNTDFVFEQLQALVTFKHSKKLIPLGPLRRNRLGSALLVPPTLIMKIGDSLNQSKSKNILLFDDALISGRTNSELKHVLFCAGAKMIYTMCIIDRRRLPEKVVDIGTVKAYWRFDVPTIGNEDTCPICRALEKAGSFSNAVISLAAKKRIGFWQEEWKLASSYTDWTHYGLPPVAITLKLTEMEYTKKANVSLRRSTGLSTYVSELHTMVFQDDYVLDVLDNEIGLNDSARLELITTQLILFNNEFSFDIRKKLLVEIFKILKNSNEVDRHSSFAALVFFIQDNNLLISLAEELFKTDELNQTIQNKDLSIAFTFIRTLINNSELLSSISLKSLAALLNPGDDLASLYDCFHWETYTEFGHPHAKAINKFINETLKISSNQISDLLTSFDNLQHICEKIKLEIDLPRSVNQSQSSQKLLEDINNNLSEVYKEIESIVPNSEDDLSDIKGKVAIFNTKLLELHERLFYRLYTKDINSKGKRKFETEELVNLLNDRTEESLQSMRNKNRKPDFDLKHNKILEISISGDVFPINRRDEVWVIWDSRIYQLVTDLAINVIHTSEPITDYWKNEQGTAYMWIQVKYNEQDLVISLASASNESAKEVGDKFKPRSNHRHLEDLGGRIERTDVFQDKIHILLTNVHLPYAGSSKYFKPQKE